MLRTIIPTHVAVIKSGKTSKGSWTLYRVKTSDGHEVTTFDDLQGMLGMEVAGDVTETEKEYNGKMYTNYNFSLTKERKGKPVQKNEGTELLREIKDGIDTMIGLLMGISNKNQ